MASVMSSNSTGGPQNPSANLPGLIAAMPFWQGAPTQEVVDLILHETEQERYSHGQTLTVQDEECTRVYFLLDGQVRLQRERLGPSPQGQAAGPQVQILDKVVDTGYLVGRFSLTYNLPYTSTATAVGDVTVLAFPASAFERLIYRYPALRGQLTRQAIINRLRTMPLMARVGLISLSYLSEEVEVIQLAKGDSIYAGNQPAERLFLIEQGQVEVFQPRHAGSGSKLGTGNAFGFPGSIPGASNAGPDDYGHWARATAMTTLYSLPWQHIRQLARRYTHIANPAIQNKCLEVINKITVFDKLSDMQKRNLAGYCTFQHIPQHHLIMQQGDIGDSMWVLLEGSRAVLSAIDRSGPLPPVPVDGLVYFGESALAATRSVNSTIESEPGSLWLRFHWRDFAGFVADEDDPTIREKLQIRLSDVHSGADTPDEHSRLGPGEHLVSLTRRHWLSLVHKTRWGLIGSVITAVVALGLTVLAGISYWWAIWLLGLPSALAILWGVLDHLNDFFIVTNQRIIQQEKVILTSEYRREALLEQVQNVGVRTSLWGNLFGYGVVSVFTAGSSGSIDFDFVPDPVNLQSSIFRLTSERKARYQAESRLEIQTALEKRLGLVVQLPSRVLSSSPLRSTTDDRSLSWHKRLWHYLFADHQAHWDSTEKIVWHKHWFILARQVVPLVAMAVGLLLLMAGGIVFDFYQQVDQAVTQTILSLELILGFVELILLAAIAWVVADWWNDTYELTSDRIIDIEKLPLFLAEERREARLSEVQDIRLDISSPLEMILNYGNIIVQTAATEGAFTFDHVPDPRAVKEEINRRLIEWRRNDERRKARAQMADLPDWFEMYRRLEAGMEPTQVVLDNDAPQPVKGLT